MQQPHFVRQNTLGDKEATNLARPKPATFHRAELFRRKQGLLSLKGSGDKECRKQLWKLKLSLTGGEMASESGALHKPIALKARTRVGRRIEVVRMGTEKIESIVLSCPMDSHSDRSALGFRHLWHLAFA
ncbi:hypothetical protein HPP92_002266 [Vanilla planifolia]|uniref:Uncharacterized protein n=1 Tax=Vanilla planifolia TaxID=51239 RepID=A0A835VIT4_VANPL|nr:hypothetical protein HPP92_002266 [Vanilla planifolia]